jgi:dihydroneopterin aldolase
MNKIYLEGLDFFSYHGCFKEEQQIGTHFLVDVELVGDFSKAELSDDLHHTVNYLTAYRLIKDEMAKPSKLIENVARRIVNQLFESFLQIEEINIKISKLNPPLGGKIKQVAYSISEKRMQINQ